MPEDLLMIIDPETKEAYRGGDSAEASGPLFFTDRSQVERYARSQGIEAYEVYTVPAGVLGRMKGRPHWVDGEPRT
jgi:hypothetical protein